MTWQLYLVGAWVVLSLLFTFLQPDNSDPLSGLTLLLFWALHVGFALALLQGAQIALSSLPVVAQMPPLAQVFLSGCLGAILFVPVAAVFDLVFPVADDLNERGVPWPAVLWEELTGLGGPVLIVWLALNLSKMITFDAGESVAGAAEAADPSDAGFWRRVPRHLRKDLVALSAELHYTRVHTSLGEALVLYQFGRAVDELSGTGRGALIHRSHWVALSHVTGTERDGQAMRCRLTTGLVLPVSRSRRKALQDALAAAA